MNDWNLPEWLQQWPVYVISLSLIMLFSLWLIWPRAVTIGDEIYYLGHAHALAHGRLIPSCADPYPIPHCQESIPIKYPLGWPLLLSLIMWSGISMVMHTNMIIHLLIGAIFALLLRHRGLSMGYAFLILLHPSFFLYSLTALASPIGVLLVLLAVWVFEKGKMLWSALILGIATTIHLGALFYGIAFAAYVGFQVLTGKEQWSRALLFVLVYASSASLALVGYYLTQGTVFPEMYLFGYGGHSSFSLSFIPRNGVFYFMCMALVYPLTFLGFWYNRSLDRFVISIVFAIYCSYFFIDHGRNLGESLILGQRLILPVVALLLLGYAEGLDHLPRHVGPAAVTNLFVLAMFLVCFVGIRVGKFQGLMARSAAEIDAHLPEGCVLRYDPEAAKMMPLLSHPHWFDMTPSDTIFPQHIGMYYLAARVPLSYRINEELPRRSIPGTLIANTPTSALYRISESIPRASPITHAIRANHHS